MQFKSGDIVKHITKEYYILVTKDCDHKETFSGVVINNNSNIKYKQRKIVKVGFYKKKYFITERFHYYANLEVIFKNVIEQKDANNELLAIADFLSTRSWNIKKNL